MAWTIAACLAIITVCLSACVLIQMRMIDGLFRSLSTEYRINTDPQAAKEDKAKHFSMYNNRKGDS
jgi:hypothetical protein